MTVARRILTALRRRKAGRHVAATGAVRRLRLEQLALPFPGTGEQLTLKLAA